MTMDIGARAIGDTMSESEEILGGVSKLNRARGASDE
jgi:hypothetical protein